MCAIVFSLFSLAWLYWFQADVICVIQHVLSHGHTHHSRFWAAVLITIVLLFVQVVVVRIIRLDHRAHALTYLPSFMLMALIGNTDVWIGNVSFSLWFWLHIVVDILIWLLFVWIVRKVMPYESRKEPSHMFSRRVWANMLVMVIMMMTVALYSNTNAVAHFRAAAEVAMMKGDVDKALRVGDESHETDVHLTMLRAWALAKKNELGERLFQYPIVGRGTDLLPFMDSQSRLQLLSVTDFYDALGARPVGTTTQRRYFQLLEKEAKATPLVADYKLCALLVDRKLAAFASLLPQYYELNESLPKHYREALVLYKHQSSNPVVIYNHAVTDEDWHNYRQLVKNVGNYNERKELAHDRYQGSYWYYFFYNK